MGVARKVYDEWRILLADAVVSTSLEAGWHTLNTYPAKVLQRVIVSQMKALGAHA